MIESIEYVNFQKHKKRTIELDKYVTTILGLSDQGKTSLFRGVRWLAFNRPNGTRFIRRQAKKKTCKVKIKTDRHTIVRKRGKGVNAYILDGSLQEAFGSHPPKTLRKKLRLTEANFQNQFDGPMWFTLSPGQVAKKLNEIVDLTTLDKLQSAAAVKVRNAKAQVMVYGNLYEDAKRTLKDSQWIVDCKQDWDKLQELKERRDKAIEEETELGELIDLMKEMKEDDNKFEQMIKDFDTLVANRKEKDKYAESVRVLDGEITDYQELRKACQQSKNRLKEAEARLAKAQKKSKLCPTCGQKLPKNHKHSLSQ